MQKHKKRKTCKKSNKIKKKFTYAPAISTSYLLRKLQKLASGKKEKKNTREKEVNNIEKWLKQRENTYLHVWFFVSMNFLDHFTNALFLITIFLYKSDTNNFFLSLYRIFIQSVFSEKYNIFINSFSFYQRQKQKENLLTIDLSQQEFKCSSQE